MFSSVRQMVDAAYTNGKDQYSSFRKVPSIGSVQGNWVDLSMAPGNPRPNYYTGDERAATVKTYINVLGKYTSHGMFHGPNVSPDVKHLHKLGIASLNAGVVPATVMLCDYLLYYPLIDMDNDSPQLLINTLDDPLVPSLPRYTDGIGVKAFLVASNPYAGGPAFTITYTSENGMGRVSQPMTTNTSTFIGTIVTSGVAAGLRGPFIDLQPGDKGIKSVQSITFVGPAGGLAVLVLVKPLATVHIREIGTWCEFDFLLHKMGLPRIYDGAYLNFLCMPNGTVAAQPIIGETTFIWG